MNASRIVTLCVTLTLSLSLRGAALPEPAAARVQQVGYLAMVHQRILNATPLCRSTANICAEYAGGFQKLHGKGIILGGKASINGQASITCVSQIGQRYVLTGNELNNDLEVFDAETGKRTRIKSPHTQPIISVVYQQPFTVITGSYDKTLRAWDIRNGETSRLFSQNHPTKMLALVGKTRLVSAMVRDAYIWDLPSGRLIRAPHGSLYGKVSCLLSLHENCSMAVGSDTGQVKIFNNEDGSDKGTIRTSRSPVVSLASFLPGELVTLDKRSQASIWDMTSRVRLHQAELISARRLITCGDEVMAMPEFFEHGGKNVWRIRKTPEGIVHELDDLGLPAGLHIDATCSTENSFTLVTRETNDPLYANSANWAEKPTRNVIYTFRKQFGEGPEEKLEPQVQKWLDAKMNAKESSYATT